MNHLNYLSIIVFYANTNLLLSGLNNCRLIFMSSFFFNSVPCIKRVKIYERKSQFQATNDSLIVTLGFKWKNIIKFYYTACAVFGKSMVLNRNCRHSASVATHLSNVSVLGLIKGKALKPSKETWRSLLSHQCLSAEAYSEPSRTLKMELFMKIVNGF